MKIINAKDIKEQFFEYRENEESVVVKNVLREVREQGDDVVKKYTFIFDGVNLENMEVDASTITDAYKTIDNTIITAMNFVAKNIKKFAKKQLSQFTDFEMEIVPGTCIGQRVVPIERVGIYVPGGKFPLVSTLLMCAIPARVAGVKELVVCSPPSHKGSIHPAILAAAKIAGVDELYSIGGTQAIAAMAYGTETIHKVDKIVGPGNKYVIAAKKEVFGVVGIDFIAGPTEVLIIADETADPEIIAADLLAQAEHDENAVSLLITTSRELAQRVNDALEMQLETLATKTTAKKAVEKNGLIILAESLDEAVRVTNKKAPEHVELQIENPNEYIKCLKNYGSLSVGEYSTGVLADYSSGLNHTLPTNTCARYTGGLSVKDFIKFQTTLTVTKKGGKIIGLPAKILAETEGLEGHVKSIEMRRKLE